MESKLDMEAFQDHQVEEMELLPREEVAVVKNELYPMLLVSFWLWLIHGFIGLCSLVVGYISFL